MLNIKVVSNRTGWRQWLVWIAATELVLGLDWSTNGIGIGCSSCRLENRSVFGHRLTASLQSTFIFKFQRGNNLNKLTKTARRWKEKNPVVGLTCFFTSCKGLTSHTNRYGGNRKKQETRTETGTDHRSHHSHPTTIDEFIPKPSSEVVRSASSNRKGRQASSGRGKNCELE